MIAKKPFKTIQYGERKIIRTYLSSRHIAELDKKPDEVKTNGKSLFVFFNEDRKIIEIDSTGATVDQYYFSEENFPLKHSSLASFHPTNDRIRIVDLKSNKLWDVSLSKTKSSGINIEIPSKISRIGFISNNYIGYKKENWKTDKHLSTFQLLNTTTGNIKNIESLIPPIDYNGIIYDGFFLSSKTQLYYINYYCNYISCIDTTGTIKYRSKTIDNIAPPDLKTGGIDWVTYVSDNGPINLCGTTDNQFLYIAVNIPSTTVPGSYIDLYTLEDGKYHGSYIIPDIRKLACSSLCKINNKLFAVFNKTIACFDEINIQNEKFNSNN